MKLRIGPIVWGVRNIATAVDFWSKALNCKLKREPDVNGVILIPEDGNGIQLSLKLVRSEQAKRHHIDLFAENRNAEVKRLIELGAIEKNDWAYQKDADYVVLVDPEGNTFCVVQA